MNVSHHRQAILVFGIALPLFCIVAIAVATFIGSSKLKDDYEKKVASLERYKTAQQQVNALAQQTLDQANAGAAQAQQALNDVAQGALNAAQDAVQQAQQQALQRPEIAPRIEAFQEKIEARMLAVNPEAGALMERLGELQTQLMAMMVQQ